MENTLKEKFLIVGSGGRESAIALRLAEDTTLYAVMDHKNPTILEAVNKSGGDYEVFPSTDAKRIAEFARERQIDYAFVSADAPLAHGVIDALRERKIRAVGGTKAATRIEWDKVYAMDMMQRECPEFTPYYAVVEHPDQVDEAIDRFEKKRLQVVVKPQGLTGGKGVKVMPEHLATYADCADYARRLLHNNPDDKVLLVEKLNGIEFTIMGFTDGQTLATAPATYDYPFRFDDDKGPGTGGMGCFTDAAGKLFFMDEQDASDCQTVMQRIIDAMRRSGVPFDGVLNGGFFKTAQGIRFMEFNSRFGDPEGLNILTLLEGSFADLVKDIYHRRLADASLRFASKSSVVTYLVAKEYPDASDEATSFEVDEAALKEAGVALLFASCVNIGERRYQTLKKSRVAALVSVADRIEDAAQTVNKAIKNHIKGDLDYRQDIGATASLQKINAVAKSLKELH